MMNNSYDPPHAPFLMRCVERAAIMLAFISALIASDFRSAAEAQNCSTVGSYGPGCSCRAGAGACDGAQGVSCQALTQVCGDKNARCFDGGDCASGVCNRPSSAAGICRGVAYGGRCASNFGCEPSNDGVLGICTGSAGTYGTCRCRDNQWYSGGRCRDGGETSGCAAGQWIDQSACTGFGTVECGVCRAAGSTIGCDAGAYEDDAACDGTTTYECVTCESCDATCDTCDGSDDDECLSCPAGATLEAGQCVTPLPQGDACVDADECASGFCADGYCCDTACGGSSADDCMVCAEALGANMNGVCGAASDGAVCNDSLYCSAGDVCTAGVCDGPSPCAAMEVCIEDTEECMSVDPGSDAGALTDGGLGDAGADAGAPPDAGPGMDGGPTTTDAGASMGGDGGPGDVGVAADSGSGGDSGGCSVVNRPGGSGHLPVMGLALFLLGSARRRASKRRNSPRT